MTRDTFEANPGLCELFKRKILDRAHSAGLSPDLIDFKSRIDMKGTFQESMQVFYRAYPLLGQDSDYIQLRRSHGLSGAALEQSWRSYERNNRSDRSMMPELTVTFSITSDPTGFEKEDEQLSKAIDRQNAMNPSDDVQSGLMKMVLDRVTAMVGENATKAILHRIGREIGSTAFHSFSTRQEPTQDPVEALDHAIRIRGLGRVIDMIETRNRTNLTYTCTINAERLRCNIIRGIVTRWLESHLHKKVDNLDDHCTTQEPHPCAFHITFKN